MCRGLKKHNLLSYVCEKKYIKWRTELGLFSQVWYHDMYVGNLYPACQVKATFGVGSAGQIRIYRSEEYRTVLNCTELFGGNGA